VRANYLAAESKESATAFEGDGEAWDFYPGSAWGAQEVLGFHPTSPLKPDFGSLF
jgi:hypothetical protein